MNVNQKILTGIALVAFLVSASNVQWEKVTFFGVKIQDKTVVNSPIWQTPNLPQYFPSASGEEYSTRYESHLLWSPLIGIWITIGVVYVGLFFLLKNTPSILVLLNQSSKKKQE